MWAIGKRSRYPNRVAVALPLAVCLVLSFGFGGCRASADPRPPAAPGNAASLTCGVDEVREYLCDDLVVPNPTLQAAPPFEACPSSIEDPVGQFDPEPKVATFDPSYTEHTRRRAPPGHSCCYSWCSRVVVADPNALSITASCTTGKAFREEYCMPELEGGTSLPAPAPFERCPLAMKPPARAVFSVPESAVLDGALTTNRRSKGDAQCCYSWCSQAPLGSDLAGR